jgi:hypothetical protein
VLPSNLLTINNNPSLAEPKTNDLEARDIILLEQEDLVLEASKPRIQVVSLIDTLEVPEWT